MNPTLNTDLLGNYVRIPSEGDSGWIHAVWIDGSSLKVLVCRDNSSNDFRIYFGNQLALFDEKQV